jgi:tetratricopeptide (TPR) repeat protein
LVFATAAVTLCCFFCGSSSYLSDFMPPLMMLAVIGACALESALKGRRPWLLLFRASWCLLLFYTLTVSVLAGFKIHAYSNYLVGNSLAHQKRDAESLERFQKCVALDPTPVFFHTSLGNAYTQMGNMDAGMAEYRNALARDPANVETLYDLSLSLMLSGRVGEAAAFFQKATQLNPDFLSSQNPGVQNNVAWSLATNPDPAKRNGQIAIQLAEAACRQTKFKTTIMLGTLAAAYAEAGRFEDAISTGQKACALAADAHDADLLKNNQKLLSFYTNHLAYREHQ